MSTIHAKKAYLHSGWASNVRLRIADDLIESVEIGRAPHPNDVGVSVVIPGIANAHSHAFQRALAGHAERREPTDESTFWSWRAQMYGLAGKIDADGLTAIARQAYAEMITFGYTSVAEFHYLHGTRAGLEESRAMFQAILTAAEDTGIRLTYVPVLYERGGFDRREPAAEQRHFAMTADEFVEHYEFARDTAGLRIAVGIGAHSLRAVARQSLARLADVAERDGCPMHIHIAEQTAEVAQCLARHGLPPIEWLLREFSLNERWCLVHATHVSGRELEALCKSGAVICLCPTTEANLGDGLFPLQAWLQQGGRIAIGSDSQITINPFEELRWLEYGQRLLTRSRHVAAVQDPHTGRSLFDCVLKGGGLACGNGTGSLRAGCYADLLVLDEASPMLAGHDAETMIDALVFSGGALPIDRVMVGGEWRVLDGVHVEGLQAKNDFLHAVGRLWSGTRVAA